MSRPPPQAANGFYPDQADLLLRSYRHWTGRELLPTVSNRVQRARALFLAHFAVLAHGPEPDPKFNYGNALALRLFERSWEGLVQLPSRESAEPMNRESRAELLMRVHRDGFTDDYTGVRISASGRRFEIHNALVWNLLDDTGMVCGQAASFSDWKYL